MRPADPRTQHPPARLGSAGARSPLSSSTGSSLLTTTISQHPAPNPACHSPLQARAWSQPWAEPSLVPAAPTEQSQASRIWEEVGKPLPCCSGDPGRGAQAPGKEPGTLTGRPSPGSCQRAALQRSFTSSPIAGAKCCKEHVPGPREPFGAKKDKSWPQAPAPSKTPPRLPPVTSQRVRVRKSNESSRFGEYLQVG